LTQCYSILLQSSDSNSDANKLKKLTKELLALERAYAILQAQVGSTVDVERDELVRVSNLCKCLLIVFIFYTYKDLIVDIIVH